MTRHMAWKRTIRGALVGSVCAFALASAAMAQTADFNVPAGDLKVALDTFIRQSGVQLIYRIDDVRGRTTQGVHGVHSSDEALNELLDGSGFIVKRDSSGAMAIVKASKPEPAPNSTSTTAIGTGAVEDITEVVVTGTHIRGANPTSPVHVVSRRDIDASGYSQIGDLMRSLPENFAGGQNPAVQSAASVGNPGNNNTTNASTINLRGLGSDATLVLLNGHRLSADSYFQGSDISGIPLGAVQRIDIVPDGASALYGADAVAGVVNIKLRRNLNGTELSGRFGITSEGGGGQRLVGILSGISRSNWYVLGNAEYSKQDALTWADRNITATGGSENTLLQAQERKSLFLSAGVDLNARVNLSFDGLFSERSATSSTQATSTSAQYLNNVRTPAYSTAATGDIRLSDGWTLHVTGVASGSRNRSLTEAPSISYLTSGTTKNDVRYLEVYADGTLLELPSGEVKVAIGFGDRAQSYYNTGNGIRRSRTISYAFGEAEIPLVAQSETRTGLHALDLNISGRTEDYSDFGKSANPKVGIRYVPFNSLTFRGTWGKSFKAPSFDQMYNQSFLYLRQASNFGYTGSGTALYTTGGNPNLKPEKATSWTFGADFQPGHLRSLVLSATYFDIDFTDRIVSPISPPTQGLSNPIFAPFVTTSPSAALQAELFSSADNFINFSGADYDAATVIAFLNNQNTNATAQTVKGVDLSYRDTFKLGRGTVDTFGNLTSLRMRQQTITTKPSVLLSGTIFNVPDLKVRTGFAYSQGGLSATAILNYIGEETETIGTTTFDIASWTTVDANLSYKFRSGESVLRNVTVQLAASNLFDKRPSYTITPSADTGPHFDSTNASIVGRYISLAVRKSW